MLALCIPDVRVADDCVAHDVNGCSISLYMRTSKHHQHPLEEGIDGRWRTHPEPRCDADPVNTLAGFLHLTHEHTRTLAFVFGPGAVRKLGVAVAQPAHFAFLRGAGDVRRGGNLARGSVRVRAIDEFRYTIPFGRCGPSLALQCCAREIPGQVFDVECPYRTKSGRGRREVGATY
jgi:hypothetical protein